MRFAPQAEKVPMTFRRALGEELGLRRARPGSLDWPYAAVLLGGVVIGCLLGNESVETVAVSWLMPASLIIWQPAIEEFLFRGVLQGTLLTTRFGPRKLAGLSTANLLTSAAFVLMHTVNHDLPWAIGVAFPSLIFGYFRDRSGSLWPPFLLHVLFNAAFFAPLLGLG